MLENMFTTKMSTDKKFLQQRFLKIRTKNGGLSKLSAIIIFLLIIAVIAVSALYIAVSKANENKDALSGNDIKTASDALAKKEELIKNSVKKEVSESIDKDFEYSDLKEMQNITLIIGGKSYSPKDPKAMWRIEEILLSANPIKMGGTGCPFDASLIIINKNKQKSKIELATDTCAVYKSKNAYYDYRNTGSTELYSLFGIDIKEIPSLLGI